LLTVKKVQQQAQNHWMAVLWVQLAIEPALKTAPINSNKLLTAAIV